MSSIMPTKNRQVESRMISQYLKEFYSEFSPTTNVALGVIPVHLIQREGYQRAVKMYDPYRPRVDGVVVLPRYILIIEAKVWNVINGLSKLPLYKSLVPVTPEFAQYMPREVLMQLVVGWENPNLLRMAHEIGVEVKLFCPEWLEGIKDEMHKYWTRDYRLAREQKLRMREYFGIE